MGFRNPITTAEAVDTGQPAGAGARLYQGSDTAGVYGVLEFRDGIEGDAPAQVVGRANLVPQGGGYTQQGGGLALKGGSYNGVTAPEWDVNVEPAPSSGYWRVARLKGADLAVLDAASIVRGDNTDWRAGLVAAPINFPGSGSVTGQSGLPGPKLYRSNDGWVQAGGHLLDPAGGAANKQIGLLPAGYRPLAGTAALAIPCFANSAYNLYPVNVQTNGAVISVAATPAGIVYFLEYLVFQVNN